MWRELFDGEGSIKSAFASLFLQVRSKQEFMLQSFDGCAYKGAEAPARICVALVPDNDDLHGPKQASMVACDALLNQA